MHWLAGRLAVVTGASRGIGAATAAAVAAAGAHVVLAARDHQALDGVAGRIKDAGGRATALPTDVSDESAVERCRVPGGQHHVSARRRQGRGGRRPDPAAGPRDQCHPSR